MPLEGRLIGSVGSLNGQGNRLTMKSVVRPAVLVIALQPVTDYNAGRIRMHGGGIFTSPKGLVRTSHKD